MNDVIHYQLRCAAGHGFDGWFRDSAAFDRQAAAGLVECPDCGARDVRRAPMAPAVSRRAAPPPAPRAPVPVPASTTAPNPAPGPGAPMAGGPMPDGVRAALQRLRAEVERRCEYVGADFADEARRIHAGESEARGIYGEATPEQAEQLADEGIAVARVPWVPRADG